MAAPNFSKDSLSMDPAEPAVIPEKTSKSWTAVAAV